MEFWKSKKRKARKPHNCEYCGAGIKVGETYFRESGMAFGDFDDYCLCERCKSVLPYFAEGRDELGEFYDDLFNTDICECPKCGSIIHYDYEFADNMKKIDLECDECGHCYTVDLSAEAIKAYFERQKKEGGTP